MHGLRLVCSQAAQGGAKGASVSRIPMPPPEEVKMALAS